MYVILKLVGVLKKYKVTVHKVFVFYIQSIRKFLALVQNF